MKQKPQRGLIGGIAVFAALIAVALLCPLLTPYDPLDMQVAERLRPPGDAHLFGTDEFGRDLFTRVLFGTRISIGVGISVAAFSALLGLTIGVYAAWNRILDHVFMRVCDGVSAIPGILLAIALMTAFEPSVWNVIIALTIVSIPGVARVVRSNALVVRKAAFVESLVVQGASPRRIIWRHIVPNVLSPLFVQTAFVFAMAILSEASLSFLGAGIPAPAPSWGNILQSGKQVITRAWWMIVFPGAAVALSVVTLNVLGDSLRDVLDTRLKPGGG